MEGVPFLTALNKIAVCPSLIIARDYLLLFSTYNVSEFKQIGKSCLNSVTIFYVRKRCRENKKNDLIFTITIFDFCGAKITHRVRDHFKNILISITNNKVLCFRTSRTISLNR